MESAPVFASRAPASTRSATATVQSAIVRASVATRARFRRARGRVRRARRRIGVDAAIARYVDDATSMVAFAHTVRKAHTARSRGARKYLIKNKKVGHAGVVVEAFETHRATRMLATINHRRRGRRAGGYGRARATPRRPPRETAARARWRRGRALASRARMVVVPFGGAATSSTSTTTREGHRWMVHGAAVVEPR